MNFVESLRTPFYIEHLWWLLLEIPFCQLVAFLFVVPQFVAFEFFNFHMVGSIDLLLWVVKSYHTLKMLKRKPIKFEGNSWLTGLVPEKQEFTENL